jgi:hypothetical protein
MSAQGSQEVLPMSLPLAQAGGSLPNAGEPTLEDAYFGFSWESAGLQEADHKALPELETSAMPEGGSDSLGPALPVNPPSSKRKRAVDEASPSHGSFFKKWTVRLPRKTRSDAGRPRKAGCEPLSRSDASVLDRSNKYADGGRQVKRKRAVLNRRRAKAPAVLQESSPGQERRPIPQGRAARLAAGRTLQRLLVLARLHILQRPLKLEAHQPLQPRRGLSGILDSKPVIIVGSFERRGVPMADVIELKRGCKRRSGFHVARLSKVRTVKASEISGVGLRFEVASKKSYNNAVLLFKEVSGDAAGHGPRYEACQLPASFAAGPSDLFTSMASQASLHPDFQPAAVVPRSWLDHKMAAQQRGEYHIGTPREDRRKIIWILDCSFARPVAASPYRCSTCKRSGLEQCNFQVTDHDVLAAFPDVLVHATRRQRTVFMTKAFLLQIVETFFESLNARSVRRSMAQVYTASCLSYQIGGASLPMLGAIPGCHVLRLGLV